MRSKPAQRNLREYLTVAQAAEVVGVSASTLRNWDRSGKVRARRHPVNGYRLYRRDELAPRLSDTRGGTPMSSLSPHFFRAPARVLGLVVCKGHS
ncbi:MAG: MerR family DNA-binding transcriptional regulator [Pyrinomonadaceae bacterium]|nr:MerR family DNA-binding transcriptional regulator [Phycisphaerales bacterium]